jgi:hypothetical protein
MKGKKRNKLHYHNRLPKKLYKEAFDFLQYMGLNDPKIPMKILKAIDEVSDYFGDIFMGRNKQ